MLMLSLSIPPPPYVFISPPPHAVCIRYIVALTDGSDNSSKIKQSDLERNLAQAEDTNLVSAAAAFAADVAVAAVAIAACFPSPSPPAS
jgi:hypothetical protein